MSEEKKLRVWWMSNLPSEVFYKEVDSPKEGREVLDILAEYDLYLGELIESNVGGMEEMQENGWFEWEDENGCDIYESKRVNK